MLCIYETLRHVEQMRRQRKAIREQRTKEKYLGIAELIFKNRKKLFWIKCLWELTSKKNVDP